jgi:hypothetical protein
MDKAALAYETLTRRDVRRAWPSEPETVLGRIEAAVDQDKPLKLVGFWGGFKQTRSAEVDGAERAALKRLAETVERIPGGAYVVLLFADTHATEVNGASKEDVQKYFEGVKSSAAEYGFEVRLLSSETPPGENGFDEARRRASELLADKNLEQKLTSMAERHCKLAEEIGEHAAARRYLETRLREDAWLSRKYSDAVMFTYSSPELHKIISSIPSVFFYSIRRGVCDCPWFVDGSKAVSR